MWLADWRLVRTRAHDTFELDGCLYALFVCAFLRALTEIQILLWFAPGSTTLQRVARDLPEHGGLLGG